MADCREKLVREDCGELKVGDGKITLTHCGEEIADFTMDQCENQVIDVPCPGDGKLTITACGTKYQWSANSNGNLAINLDDCYDHLSCDDCLIYLEPGSSFELPAPLLDAKKLKLIKFGSNECGLCHKMGHYDCTVAEELNIEFHCVLDTDVEALEYWTHVTTDLYDSIEDMGWPTYILVNHEDEINYSVIGEIIGGTDKGLFRTRIQNLMYKWDHAEILAEDCKGGSGADSPDGHCNSRTCNTFKWDCKPNNVKVCAGGCYDAYATTHGCDGECPGSELEYRWLLSEPGQNKYQVVRDWSRNVRYTIETKDDAKVGKTYDGRIQAKCGNFPGGSDMLVHDFSVEIKQCGKTCPPNGWVSLSGCPGQPKKAGSTVELSANANGLANSNVTYEWYKGGTNGSLEKTGGPNFGATVPAEGATQKYTVKGIWDDDGTCTSVASCTLVGRVDADCTVDKDCPNGFECEGGKCVEKDECQNNSDCGPCRTCVDGKCRDKCASNEECVGGECVPKVTPGPNPDCPDGGWVIDYDCVAGKLGVRTQAETIDALSTRLAALESAATDSEA